MYFHLFLDSAYFLHVRVRTFRGRWVFALLVLPIRGEWFCVFWDSAIWIDRNQRWFRGWVKRWTPNFRWCCVFLGLGGSLFRNVCRWAKWGFLGHKLTNFFWAYESLPFYISLFLLLDSLLGLLNDGLVTHIAIDLLLDLELVQHFGVNGLIFLFS